MFFNNKKKQTPKKITFTGTAVVDGQPESPDTKAEARYLDLSLIHI